MVCNDGFRSRLGSYDTSMYPSSRPSTPEVKPLLPALLFILSTPVAYKAPRAVLSRSRRRGVRSPYSKGPGPLI
jgi:hypothetical protein